MHKSHKTRRFKVRYPLGQSGKDKLLTRFRWMGTWCAVYSPSIQEKAERRGEDSCARRGTKRRGKRSGSRNARKCRRLVTADPGSSERSYLQAQSARWSYLRDHRVSWLQSRIALLARLSSAVTRSGNSSNHSWFDRSIHDRLVGNCRGLRQRLVDVMSRSSRDPPEFCRIKLEVYLKILRQGWDNLPIDEIIPQESSSHAVPPPPSLTKVGRWHVKRGEGEDGSSLGFVYSSPRRQGRRGGKNRQGEGNHGICRQCGERHPPPCLTRAKAKGTSDENRAPRKKKRGGKRVKNPYL